MHRSSQTFIKDFTSGSVLPTMITFAFPLFLANLLQAIYGVVDMVVVGRVVGEVGLAGVTIGDDVLSLLTFLVMGFASAAQTIISQYIGAGLRERLSQFIGTIASFLLLCAVAMSVICLLTKRQILSLMNTPPEAWDQAMAYVTTCMFGLVFIYGYNIVGAIMRGLGDSKRPLMFIAIAAGLNLILDLIFVAGFRWEAFGAALATVIAQAFSFLVSLLYLYINRDRVGVEFSLHSFCINRTELSALIKLGVPMAVRTASIRFSKLFCNSWLNSYGVTISAVTGAGHKVDLFGNLLGQSISAASNAMVGQNIGAAKYERVTRILGISFFLNGICFAVMIALVALFPRTVFGVFTSDPDVLLVCMDYVPVALVAFVSAALRDSMYGFTNGCGNYKLNFWVAIVDGIVARIGFSILLGVVFELGYFGFWMGSAIAGSVPFLIGGAYYLSGRWRKQSSIVNAQ